MEAYIKAIAYYLPEKVVTNEQLVEEFPEWSVDKIAKKVGINERHIAADDETAGDMAYKAAEKGFEVAFGKKPLAARRGGSIPIISTFEQVLGQKTILMGFGLESNAIHSPNENMDLEVFENGIVAVTEFYKEYSRV